MTERSDNSTVGVYIATIQEKASYVLNLTFDIGHALAVRKLYSTRV